MNQEQNNLNLNNFNTQGNNGIPNNQPFTSMNQGLNNTINQNMQKNVNQMNNTYSNNEIISDNVSNLNISSDKKNNNTKNKRSNKKIILAILLIVIIAAIIVFFVFGIGNKGNNNENADNNLSNNNSNQQNNNNLDSSIDEITLDTLNNYPVSPQRDFEIVDHGNGEIELVRYLGDDEIVVIPNTVNGKAITSIASYVFGNQSNVKAIKLSDSIKVIQGWAFSLNTALEIVVCGNGLEEIGVAAFQNCTNLKEIILNDGLVKLDKISLSGLNAMKSIEIPTTVTDISFSAFYASPKDFTIIGEPGSAAEQYANNEGINFQAK